MLNDNPNWFKICKKCGVKCCKPGPIASEKERQAIIKAGHPDLFVKEIFKGVPHYKLNQRKDDFCAYLNPDNSCSIYSLRPIECRAFPISLKANERIEFLIAPHKNCPLRKILTSEDIENMKKEISKLPDEIKQIAFELSKKDGYVFVEFE